MGLGEKLERQREERLQAERKKLDTNLQLISEVQQLQRTVRDLSDEVAKLRKELPDAAERAAQDAAPSMLWPVVVTVVCTVVSTFVLWRCVATKTGNVWRLVDGMRQALGV